MPSKDLPLISVIITNYNYGDYIGQAIESVLNQTYTNIELIVVNDGSTDNSDIVIKKFVKQKPDIKYIKQKNLGANVSRNKGLSDSGGEFIFFLDADNWLNPDHLESLYRTLLKKKADIVYGDIQDFNGDTSLRIMPEFSLEILKIANYIDTSSLIRKKAIGKSLFDIELNRKFLQDWDFYLGLALKGLRIVKCPDVRLNYRVHDKQHGNNAANAEKIDKYFVVYNYIIGKYRDKFPSHYNNSTEWFITQHLYSHRLQRSIYERDEGTIYLNKIIAEKDKTIASLNKIIAEKDGRIIQLLNSRSYRLGHLITKPYRLIRK